MSYPGAPRDPSITEAYLLGEQREIRQREADIDNKMKRMQLENLMRERVAEGRRTTQRYIEAHEKFVDPETPTSELGKYLAEAGFVDAEPWLVARRQAIKRKEERDADIAQVDEVLTLKSLFRGREAMGPDRPAHRQSLVRALESEAIGRRQAETQEDITERYRMGETGRESRFARGLKSKEDIERNRLLETQSFHEAQKALMQVRGAVDEKRLKLYDARLQKLTSELARGYLPDHPALINELIWMQTSSDTPTAEATTKATLAAQDIEDAVQTGEDPTVAFHDAIRRHKIGESEEALEASERFKAEKGKREAKAPVAPPEVKAQAETVKQKMTPAEEDARIKAALEKLKWADTPENRDLLRQRLRGAE